MIDGHHAGFYYQLLDSVICVYAGADSGAMLRAYPLTSALHEPLAGFSPGQIPADVLGEDPEQQQIDELARALIDRDYTLLQQLESARRAR